MMLKEPFLKAIPVIKKIEDAGFEAYFVGGSVRDLLMNKPIDDVDIATSATPEEIKNIFDKTVDVGIEHGTILVLYGGESYEITTFRTEGNYVDYRRPESVSFVKSLEEDLSRRDFTMNAIAMTKEGNFIDPFHGMEDIKNKIIRSVGNPENRFSEDALRMLRAVRFVSQLGFEMEAETNKALAKLAHLLEHIAVERKLIEFGKLLIGEYKTKALQLFVDSGLYRYVPLFINFSDSLKNIAKLTDGHILTENEMWALIMILIEQDQESKPFRAWKMSTKQMKEIQAICRVFRWRKKNDWTKIDLYRFGLNISKSAEKLFSLINNKDYEKTLEEMEKIFDSLPIKERKELAVSGNDLMIWENRKSGPWIKERLEMIENAVVNGELENEKLKIKEWLNLWNNEMKKETKQ